MAPDPREELIASLQAAVEAVPASGDGPLGAVGTGDTAVSGGALAAAGAAADPSAPGSPENPDYRAARKRAYSLLAMRDHSRAELREKLLRKEHAGDSVEILLDRLEASDLLNDRRYAQQFVRVQREQKGLSASALQRRLREKGVSDEDARASLEDLDDDFPHALALARRKAASTRTLDRDTRLRRILGVLGRRGFAGGTAMRAAQEALDEEC